MNILVVVFAIICVLEFLIIRYLCKKCNMKINQLNNAKKMVMKNDRLFIMALKWAQKNNHSNCVYDYLKKKGYTSIIIYGMHSAGEVLAEQLRDTDIEVVCGMDRNASDIVSFINVISPESHIPKADAIIVTAVTAFCGIEENLINKVECPVISLEDIIYD